MTNQPVTSGSTVSSTQNTQEQMQSADNKKVLLKDIHVKWGKFTEQEVGNLKSNDDLVNQLVAKYGLTKDIATRDANTLRAGRNI